MSAPLKGSAGTLLRPPQSQLHYGRTPPTGTYPFPYPCCRSPQLYRVSVKSTRNVLRKESTLQNPPGPCPIPRDTCQHNYLITLGTFPLGGEKIDSVPVIFPTCPSPTNQLVPFITCSRGSSVNHFPSSLTPQNITPGGPSIHTTAFENGPQPQGKVGEKSFQC